MLLQTVCVKIKSECLFLEKLLPKNEFLCGEKMSSKTRKPCQFFDVIKDGFIMRHILKAECFFRKAEFFTYVQF